jgi:DNA processing protein
LDEQKLKYLHALNIILYSAPNFFKKTLEFFGDSESLWNKANFENLQKLGLREKTIEKFLSLKKQINIENEWEKLKKLKILSLSINEYPLLLKEIFDPPIILYTQGNISLLNNKCLSIVGTRNITQYGKKICENFIPEFIKADLTLVSGYAHGVDFEVHKLCLENNGKTIAILASGLDLKYPDYPQMFVDKFIKNALFLTEYPLGIESMAYSFPRRNRLISGFSQATLIIEAKEKSGSLITARLALEQNRDVFSVPGNIFAPQNYGTNLLIQKGEAEMCLSPNAIIEKIYGNQIINQKEKESQSQKIDFSSEIEKTIYEILKNEELFFDEILLKIEIQESELSVVLSMMEIKGLISNIGGGKFAIK